ncbi:Wzz/FepE/Etk N-terminal domain-containing protein [Guyparkeria sp. SCN-R1]|uniref:Wzz/FepE/Etk N-terminal domain-containing protein n=1 Tax=Guyparkeria sp. SCN-R1 TaxID=2341113 RepID=UPI0013151B14|nr:Wzz/FepE/Etk N-terminal domain-containing protein [Guyparkeria sp. SCN-R1]
MNEIQHHQAPSPNPPRFDDEIDLVDLALALWRRKWTVVIVAVVITALAAVFAFARGETAKPASFASIYSLPKTFDESGEGRFVIEPGAVMQVSQRVFVPKSLKEDQKANPPEEFRELEVTLDQPEDTALVVLETEATAAEAKRVEVLHESITDRIASLVEGEIEELRGKIERRIEMLETRLANAESLAESLAQAGGDLADISLEISEVKADLLAAELQKSSLNGGRLVELGQQRELEGISNPLIMALGGILGLFAGLFAALMANFIAAARERLQDQASSNTDNEEE